MRIVPVLLERGNVYYTNNNGLSFINIWHSAFPYLHAYSPKQHAYRPKPHIYKLLYDTYKGFIIFTEFNSLKTHRPALCDGDQPCNNTPSTKKNNET